MSARKTISNSFVVTTVLDGESAPYYFQEWFAWSNNSTTASVTTAPTIAGSWATSIPAQGSYAYLWRKSIRYVWNDNTRQYTAETPQYFRMSGTNGTSITPKGNALAYTDQNASTVVPNPTNGDIVLYVGSSHAPDNLDKYEIYDWSTMAGSWEGYVATDGDSYVLPNGHLMMFSTEADDWLDLGQFQGENGETWYLHVAWATNVDTNTTPITVTGFVTTKSPNDTTHIWMGVLVDQNSGQDSSNATLYTWSNTKGNNGDNGESAAIAHASTEQISIPCNSNGSVSSQVTVAVSFSMRIGSVAASNIRVNNPSSLPTGVQYSGTSPSAGNIIISTNATASGIANGLTFTVIGSDGTKDYTSTVTIALIGVKQGSTGERGKVGRFFYFGGTFNPQDNDPTHVFVVNDAQAPYFEHTVDGQKRYHVFNYETNGSYTMTQMWSISNQSWNNAQWEVMTNDFKYIIAQAMFSEFAHFGSAIINGDFLMSQYVIAVGFDGTKQAINDPTKYIYVEQDDMFAENTFDDAYIHPSYFPVNWLTLIADDYVYIDGGEYSNDTYEQGQLTKRCVPFSSDYKMDWGGCMYTVQIQYYSKGNNLEWKIAEQPSGTAVKEGELHERYYTDSTFYTENFFITLTNPSESTSLKMFFKLKNYQSGDYAAVRAVIIRRVKFTPVNCQDMLRGKIAINELVARGQLYAESFFYEVRSAGGNNKVVVINQETIVNLSKNSQGSTVILPMPSESVAGRVIEISCAQDYRDNDGNKPSWRLSFRGMTPNDYFTSPLTSSGKVFVTQQGYSEYWQGGSYWMTTAYSTDLKNITYVKLVCVGDSNGNYHWSVIKGERTYVIKAVTSDAVPSQGVYPTIPISVVENIFVSDSYVP